MAHSDDAQAIREINDALLACPMHDRLAALMCAIVSDEARAADAIADFVGVTGIMTRQLAPAQRLRIAWAMLEEIQALNARWN